MIENEEEANMADPNVEAMIERLEALIGRKFRCRQNGKQQTRWVIDRTLGLDVVWILLWDNTEHKEPLAEFEQWLQGAKEI